MRCVAYSSNDSYKHKLIKTSRNVLEDVYEKKPAEIEPKRKENLRLRLRFKEAIQEAQEICESEGMSFSMVRSRRIRRCNQPILSRSIETNPGISP